jgi:hypothetical protein
MLLPDQKQRPRYGVLKYETQHKTAELNDADNSALLLDTYKFSDRNTKAYKPAQEHCQLLYSMAHNTTDHSAGEGMICLDNYCRVYMVTVGTNVYDFM